MSFLASDRAQRVAISLYSGMFILAGVCYAFMPEFMFNQTGSASLDVDATVDVLATFGGFQIAAGLYALSEWRNGASRDYILRLFGFILVSVGLLRSIGVVLHWGDVGMLHAVVGGSEIAGGWLALVMGRRAAAP